MIFCIWWWTERRASCGGGGLGHGGSLPFFGFWGLFGDDAVGEEAVVLVVADDEVIKEVDVEDVAGLDEFGGYFFVGAAGFGIAGWVVVDDHDGVCVGEEGAFADEFHADDVVFGVEVEDVEFFAGAFLQADGVAEVYDHFGSGDVFGVDDLGFSDEADAVAGYGDGDGFGGEERQGVRGCVCWPASKVR